MKNRVTALMGSVCLAVVLLAGITSCTTKKEYYEVGSVPTTDVFTVRASDWGEYNSYYGRYEYAFPYSKITNDIYNYGLVVGAVEVVEEDAGGTYSAFKGLPFVHTYNDGNGPYTETISFDISPGYIVFFLQTSTLNAVDPYRNTYKFKITVIPDYY